MKKRIVKNKLLLRLIIGVLLAIFLGIFYIAIISKTNKLMIKDNLKTYFLSLNKLNYYKGIISCLFSNILTIFAIWILGISIIGIPIIVITLLFKSFSLGFTFTSFIYFYKFKGILLGLIYIIPLIINLFLCFYISYYAIIFSINLNRMLFLKKQVNFKFVMKRYIKILIFTLIFIIISSCLEIYVIPNILKLLQIR